MTIGVEEAVIVVQLSISKVIGVEVTVGVIEIVVLTAILYYNCIVTVVIL